MKNAALNEFSRTKFLRNYVPSVDETYMCETHIEYFRRILEKMKSKILFSRKESNLVDALDISKSYSNDVSEDISNGTDAELELHNLSYNTTTLEEVEESLKLLESGEYGFCQETGNEIGIKRMLVNPTAKYCLEVQESIDIKNKYNNQND